MNEAQPGLGHNNPPPFDQAVIDGIRAKASAMLEDSKEWLKKGALEDDTQAQLAADHIAALRKLKAEATKAKADAKKPHVDASKAVDAAFGAVVDGIEKMISRPLDMQTVYLREKQARLEAEQKAEQERIAAEKAENEAKLAAAAASGDAIAEAEAEKAAKALEREEKRAAAPVKASVGSATGGGRTISTRTLRSAKITNARLLALHFCNDPKLIETLQSLANAHVRAAAFDGVDLPGTETYTEEKAA